MDLNHISLKIFIILILIILFLCFCSDIYENNMSYTKKQNKIISYLLKFCVVLLYIDSLYISNIFASGYGSAFFAIMMQSIFSFCWAFLFVVCLVTFINESNFKIDFKNIMFIVFSLIFILGSIYTIGCFYCRLKLEHILKIKWVDKIIKQCKNINIISNISKWLENEWIHRIIKQCENINIINHISKWLENEWVKDITKGTIAGTVSGIIVALIVDKLRKNKNSHDENVIDKE